MSRSSSWLLAGLVLLGGCALTDPTAAGAPSATLAPYRSEAELQDALTRWRTEAERLQRTERRAVAPGGVMLSAMPMTAPAPAAAPSPVAKAAAESAATADGITNVQTAGVDEGGIVKRAGDHLVILRRGRLFTVRVGGDALRPVATVDAYAPGADPQGAWYDELLISGSTVVVVGYSYARGGTEIGLFELGADGGLQYRATHHLRSNDYYSARNYASRLIGRTLVFYSPTQLSPWQPQPWSMFPAWRRWQPQATPADFQRILPATRVYRTDDDFEPSQPLALHHVTRCELGGADMRCEASAVLGPPGRVFYVSADAVYVWTSTVPRASLPGRAGTPERPETRSAVFRIPLDGSAPTGLKTAGVPVDQFSFLQDGQGRLNVLVRETGRGEGMGGSDSASGRLALLRVPLTAFGDGRGAAGREHYRRLPDPGAGAGPLQNRYVADWLLWGHRDGGWALRYADDADAVALAPGHEVERIEALGGDALLVGRSGRDLGFTAVRLGRAGARLAGRHLQPGLRQGETRSHGFYYQPLAADDGLIGLPVLSSAAPSRRPGIATGAQGSASVFYLRQRSLDFAVLGELKAATEAPAADGCKASCVDWYGNARPLFLGERVFALLGYELVEGRLDGRGVRIDERRRTSFAPGAAAADGRYSPFN